MRRRLRLLALATTSMVVLAFVAPLAWVLRDVARQRAAAKATQEAQSLASVLPVIDTTAARVQVVNALRSHTTDVVTVYLADGSTIGAPVPASGAVDRARAGKGFTTSTRNGQEVLVPVVGGNGETDGVAVGVPAERLRRGVAEAWLLLAAVAVALVVIAVAVAGRLARSMVRPIEGLATTARRIEQGDLDARASLDGPAEVVEVGRALNRLAQRILDLVAAEREALADLSHRLRTPLTALRLDVESLSNAEDARRLGGSVDELARAVSDLIGEARRPSSAPSEVVDVVPIARDRVAFWMALAEEQGRRFDVDIPHQPLMVEAGRSSLCDALDAVLGNVFAHTPDGTALQVHVHAHESTAVIVVDDEGAGFPAADVLGRGVSGAGSTGLGLDIARRTAELTSGSLRLDRSPAGGARVQITLELTATAPASCVAAGRRRSTRRQFSSERSRVS